VKQIKRRRGREVMKKGERKRSEEKGRGRGVECEEVEK
jgi:hypothetical protein